MNNEKQPEIPKWILDADNELCCSPSSTRLGVFGQTFARHYAAHLASRPSIWHKDLAPPSGSHHIVVDGQWYWAAESDLLLLAPLPAREEKT